MNPPSLHSTPAVGSTVPVAKTVAVSSTVTDYPARDMTITVGAGISVGELRQLLRTENQQLPIDVADDATTLGELVSHDISGPRQFGYGTLRDYVIGIEAVDGQGRTFHAGGRVVKNVAGYDLCRLLVGSRGQLGTLTQLTFKLKPLPVQQAVVVVGFRSLRDLEAALERLNLTATTPLILDVMSRFATESLLKDAVSELSGTSQFSDSAAVLLAGFEGPPLACQWQTTTLTEELQGSAAWTQAASDLTAFETYCRVAQQASIPTEHDPWMARLMTLPSRVVSAMTVLQDAGCDVFGRAGNGVLLVRPSRNSLNENRRADEPTAMRQLQSLVADGVGSVEVLKAAASRSTTSVPAVQAISEKLRALLG